VDGLRKKADTLDFWISTADASHQDPFFKKHDPDFEM
jgi:hypothetical protein